MLAQFQRFQPKVGWLSHFGPQVRQNIIGTGGCGGGCSAHGSQEAEREWEDPGAG